MSRPLALVAAAAAVGCAQRVESPPLSLLGLAPQLVCNAQVTTPVELRGEGLTPLPVRTLGGSAGMSQAQGLELPHLALALATDLAGSPAAGGAVPIPDDLDAPDQSRVKWRSSQAMSFDVFPELQLKAGVHDLSAQNPDGRSTLLPHALAAVPPPIVAQVAPALICNEQEDRTLAIAGSGFLRIDGAAPTVTLTPTMGPAKSYPALALSGCADIATAVRPGVQRCSGLTIVAKKGDLPPGEYKLVLRNPAPASCSSSEAKAVLVVPPPLITKAEPASICVEQGDQVVVLTGTGFLQIGAELPSVKLASAAGAVRQLAPLLSGCSEVPSPAVSGLKSCTTLTVTVKRGEVMPGSYNVTVTNPLPAGCSSTQAITVVVNPPPKIAAVSPQTICQGGGTLAIKGQGFQDKSKVTLGTSAASQVILVGPGELQASFSGGNVNFSPGLKYDLTVQSPDGCKDTLSGAVTAVAGPVLFFVDPPVVYRGIATQVTLYATQVAPPLGKVTLTPSGGGAPITVAAIIDPRHPKRILATIPKGLAAGKYDVTTSDASGCPATLAGGLTVVDKAALTLKAITPPFGWKGASTAVTITAQGGLLPTPRAYLSPKNAGLGTVATALSSVAYQSADKLSAIVPKGLDPAGNPYDLIVVNPDGTIGLLGGAYRSTDLPPPLIDGLSPGSVPTSGVPPLTISGANFRNPQVTLTCGAAVAMARVTGASGGAITVDVAAVVANLATPSLCLVRVTNDDQSWADFSALAVTNPAGNLSPPKKGADLPEARRAPALVGSAATRVARYLYAIGGDGGRPSSAVDTVLTTLADENGTAASWLTQRYRLAKPRTLAGAATLGRYLYVVGGNDGSGPVRTVERAVVLDPEGAPQVSDVDVVPGGGAGLGGGIFYYRVAALLDGNDADNPGGETLPSDPLVLQLPDLPQKVQVRLTWGAVQGAASYVVYRTPIAGQIAGQEQLLDTVGGNTLSYTDSGKNPSGVGPLPLGSTGRWRTLPSLVTPRESPGVVLGSDPQDPARRYLYATLGRDNGPLSSYELLPITVAQNGGQSFAGAWTTGGSRASSARYQHAAYHVDSGNASFVPPGTQYIYLGGGTGNGQSPVMSLEVARINPGGDLGNFSSAGTSIKSFGHGATVAANYLYTFGDEGPSTAIRAGQIERNKAPQVANFNNNGGGLLTPRYLPGTALLGALIYVAGGSEAGRGSASKSVEWMVW